MEQQHSILVVEDNEMISEPLILLLELQGYEVDWAENGRIALDKVHERPYDLILLDIMMPEMNGYDVLRYLKTNTELRHIPVVMLSALDDMQSIVQCVKLGAEDYLFKPFDRTLLKARIEASLDKKRWHDQEQAYLEQIEQERRKADELLLNILPEPVSERLKQGQEIIADGFEEVTVLFADIVDFTVLSAQLSPTEIVKLLNDIFSTFDELADQYRLEKIKTVGDEYMVVGGLPVPRDDHAEAIAEMALAMIQSLNHISQRHNITLEMRIGINSGPVVAGVIGKRKFAYDLWGDTVNTASRMETHSLANHIQVSHTTYALLQSKYLFESRGKIEVKGKGQVPVFFLKSRLNGHIKTKPGKE
ncbi:MAG: response regulator [Ardenticatenaceae bacterium]|nr:response regulator [Ardenticatenaceae bacterium]